MPGHAGLPITCSVEAGDLVSCVFDDVLPAYEAIEVEILVSATGEPPSAGAPGKVTVSGGNAPSSSVIQEVAITPEKVPFGIEYFSALAEEGVGAPPSRAGGHPFQFSTTIQLNSGDLLPGTSRRDTKVEQPALPRNVRVSLPIGLVGVAAGMPRCEMGLFLEQQEPKTKCPAEAAVGVAVATVVENANLGLERISVPVFNLPPAPGEPARFGLVPAGVPVLIDFEVDPDDQYRLIGRIRDIGQIAQFLSSTVTIWGTPGDPRHDDARGWACLYRSGEFGPCERPSALGEAAFLRMPVSCASPLDFGASIEPWNVPIGSLVDSAFSQSAALHGCNSVPFDPSIAAAATSKTAGSPTGLGFTLEMPNHGLLNKNGIAEGQAKKVEVTLPEGMTVNPSQAEGLVGCTPAEYASETAASKPGEGCPDASKIGTVQVSKRRCSRRKRRRLPVHRQAHCDNPFGSLLALYMVREDPERGILVKLAGKVEPDPVTGQLTTTFDDLPRCRSRNFELQVPRGRHGRRW